MKTSPKKHKRFMSKETFDELIESLCQALKYERGERAGFRVTYALKPLKNKKRVGDKRR